MDRRSLQVGLFVGVACVLTVAMAVALVLPRISPRSATPILVVAWLVSLGALWLAVRWWCNAIAAARPDPAPPDRPDLPADVTQREQMLREIHHRVKNNLQMISSLLSLQANGIRSLRLRRVFAAAQNRVLTMAVLHHHLYERTNWAQVNFEAFLNDLVRQLSLERGARNAPAVRFDVSAPVLAVGPDVAVPVGLVVTEAVTNAVTHAFEGIADPRVTIRAGRVDDSFVLSIDDNGTGIAPGGAQTAARAGLGFTLLRGLATQLGGNVSVSPHAGGGTRVLLACPGGQFGPVTSD